MRSPGMRQTGQQWIHAVSTFSIAAPSPELFTYIACGFFEHYRAWSPEVIVLEQTSPGAVGVGTTGRQVRRDAGRVTESSFEVTRFVPPRLVVFASTSLPRYEVEYELVPLDEHTAVHFRFQLELSPALFPLRPLLAKVIKGGTERLAAQLSKAFLVEQRRALVRHRRS